MKQPAVYLMASKRNGTLYVGVTSNLVQRVWQHKNHAVEGFTAKYHVELLVWFEQHDTLESAISREKAIKKWMRSWKLKLIEKANPEWLDLYPFITGEALDSRLRGNDGGLQMAALDAVTQAQVVNSIVLVGAPALPAPANFNIPDSSSIPDPSGVPISSVIPAPSVIPTPSVVPAPPVIPAQAGIQKEPTQ